MNASSFEIQREKEYWGRGRKNYLGGEELVEVELVSGSNSKSVGVGVLVHVVGLNSVASLAHGQVEAGLHDRSNCRGADIHVLREKLAQENVIKRKGILVFTNK
eukprot:Phypoly_transcript_28206.p1 GENE.Phypoly_transcript_28206~~Phypoly_transcript_28206.p1  ORF type:complete len:104 (-),score=12.45 Phypoly_transcript_28206:57-368(-)